jgi:Holliday junction resolvase RusA-like endonuclease
MLNFTVYGLPQPQGSIRAFTPKGWKRPVLTSDNAKVKPWRQEIAGTALAIMARATYPQDFESEEPVYVHAFSTFPRPKSTKKSVVHKTTKPDIDKLTRALHDALTGIVSRTTHRSSSRGCQIFRRSSRKCFCGPLQRVTVRRQHGS